jgi:hypothetical protein
MLKRPWAGNEDGHEKCQLMVSSGCYYDEPCEGAANRKPDCPARAW